MNTVTVPVLGTLRNVDAIGNDTVYTFLGIPYDGQVNGFDFHGTRFTPKTELGWVEGRPLPVYWEHAKGELGRQVIGSAFVGEETDEGRLLKVIINRASKYHNLISTLKEMGVLRGSGQAIGSTYDPDEETGELRSFHLAEYSLTVEPSNNLAAPVQEEIRNLFRSYGVNNFMAAKKKNGSAADATEMEIEVASETEDDEETPARSLSDQLSDAFAAQTEEVVRTAEVNLAETVRSLTEVVASLQETIRNYESRLAEAEKTILAFPGEIHRNLPKWVSAISGSELDVMRSIGRSEQPMNFAPKAADSGVRLPFRGSK